MDGPLVRAAKWVAAGTVPVVRPVLRWRLTRRGRVLCSLLGRAAIVLGHVGVRGCSCTVAHIGGHVVGRIGSCKAPARKVDARAQPQPVLERVAWQRIARGIDLCARRARAVVVSVEAQPIAETAHVWRGVRARAQVRRRAKKVRLDAREERLGGGGGEQLLRVARQALRGAHGRAWLARCAAEGPRACGARRRNELVENQVAARAARARIQRGAQARGGHAGPIEGTLVGVALLEQRPEGDGAGACRRRSEDNALQEVLGLGVTMHEGAPVAARHIWRCPPLGGLLQRDRPLADLGLARVPGAHGVQ